MARLGGCIGALLGTIVVLVVAEWIWVDWFGHHGLLEGLLVVVLVAGGAFAGSRLLPRAVERGH
jgi:hypothetical protein